MRRGGNETSNAAGPVSVACSAPPVSESPVQRRAKNHTQQQAIGSGAKHVFLFRVPFERNTHCNRTRRSQFQLAAVHGKAVCQFVQNDGNSFAESPKVLPCRNSPVRYVGHPSRVSNGAIFQQASCPMLSKLKLPIQNKAHGIPLDREPVESLVEVCPSDDGAPRKSKNR